MASRKLHTAGVSGHFAMLFTPFLFYAAAVCLISVFVFQATVGNSPTWRILTAHTGESTETEVNHELYSFTPPTIPPVATPDTVDTTAEPDGTAASDPTPVPTKIPTTKGYYDLNYFPRVRWGDRWGSLTIPALGTKNRPIYCGSSMSMLEYGVCSNYGLLPGEGGNTILTFHVNREKRSGLYNLQELKIGDRIEVTTSYGTYVYFITERFVFESEDLSSLYRTGDEYLTIYTCYPKEGPYRTRRIAVVAALDEDLSSPTWRWPDE